ncbi:MAG: AraC family transcriptional regulator [Verrucomicrobia bacterium]|nr:AraC family transcriptional regulator [Verrucomicrobiota bacterium]MBU4290351.1 AraC family transcriptional regulator [Verrucomicrobiota bacterium]MBU4430195.1 AraC family transcriptional regulator [Verrucomicrobiota bacterium]MCG2681481.1 AraC family transcriptional regulator [Kiritimatiellia bacterium]
MNHDTDPDDREGLTDLVRTVETYLREHLGERVTLADIAKQTGFVDAFHFSQTFKRVVILSPKLFVGTQCSKAH